ncbi:beta-glucanase-like [Benincasa hispida]|uniref:beta-glucanase-like n=1 Tax=Benincasa hispida TaxID=102211 RepID=UPI0019006F26|nr:beta-glucanase-like [Benincasa hispida]
MGDPSVSLSHPLKQIAIDYNPKACTYCATSNSITLTYDHQGGARWRSTTRFLYGTFSAMIRCPGGNTSGLNFNLYLSSLEGEKGQDEIDFEFLGKDRSVVQTNFYTGGVGNREQIHELGFDCGDGFHKYSVKWEADLIEWAVDGAVVRRAVEDIPRKAMYLYASMWDASDIDEGRWAGKYVGCDQPYVCVYKDIQVPRQS